MCYNRVVDLKNIVWEDGVEAIAEFVQEDGCTYHHTCGGNEIYDECPFEDCLLLSEDRVGMLGRHCLELIDDGWVIPLMADKLNCSVRSVYRYLKEARKCLL